MREFSLGARCLSLFRRKRVPWANIRYYASQKSSANHYEVLGVKRNATKKEIKSAFIAQSKKLHPDVNPNDPAKHDKFVRLNEAYSIVSKQISRRNYDQTLSSSSHMYRQAGSSYRASSSSAGPAAGTPFSGGTGPDPFSSNSYPPPGFRHGPQRPFNPNEFYESEYAKTDREGAAVEVDKMKRHFVTSSFFLMLFIVQFVFLNRYVKLRARQLREDRRKHEAFKMDHKKRHDVMYTYSVHEKDFPT